MFYFKLNFFEAISKWHLHFNVRYERTNIPYICIMGLEDKAGGLNVFIVL